MSQVHLELDIHTAKSIQPMCLKHSDNNLCIKTSFNSTENATAHIMLYTHSRVYIEIDTMMS